MLGIFGSYGMISLMSVSVAIGGLKYHLLALLVFCMALGTGYVAGAIEPVALVFFGAFLACGYVYQRCEEKYKNWVVVGLIVFSAVFALHMIPGVNNPIFLNEILVSKESIPYSQYINFDKAFVALVLLLFVAPRLRKIDTNGLLTVGATGLITIVIVLTFAISVGQIRPDLKIPDFIVGWMAINLFITCASEECMFRLLIQDPTEGIFENKQTGAWVGIAFSSIFFGLVHLQGGLYYVIGALFLSFGCAYGYYRTRNILIPIAIHFSFNLIHILFFSYPFIA